MFPGVVVAPLNTKTTRPFFVLLSVQVLLCVTRFVFGDVWGGLVMGIVAAMGYLAVMGSNIEVIYLAYYGVMVSINGLFDLMVIAELYHSGHLSMLHQLPARHIAATIVVLISPVIEFLSGYFSYRLFKETEMAECQPLFVQEGNTTNDFRPFEGKPHKLDEP